MDIYPYHYIAYGLRIRSQVAMRHLPTPPRRHTTGSKVDVTVRKGSVPKTLPAPAAKLGAWEASPGTFLLTVAKVANYLVTGGREILIESLPGASDSTVDAFLGSSVWTALLQQRGIALTLHASAIECGGAALFSGRSGIGKSTLLAALVKRGHTMLADDVSGVVLNDDGLPEALPGFPRLRLWADSLDAMELRPSALWKVRPELGKYLVPVNRFHATPTLVRTVYFLSSHNLRTIKLETISALAAFKHLYRYTHGERFLDGNGQRTLHFHHCTAMTRNVRFVRVVRPRHPYLLDELADRITADLLENPATA